jgi:hypothetical protein
MLTNLLNLKEYLLAIKPVGGGGILQFKRNPKNSFSEVAIKL